MTHLPLSLVGRPALVGLSHFVSDRMQIRAVPLTGTGRLDHAQSDARTPTGLFLDNAGVTDEELGQIDAILNGALTASFPLAERWSLSIGTGTVARPPSALERYSDRFPASKSQTSAEFQGDPTLAPERSTQADVWVDGGGTRWSLHLNGFARLVDDYITLGETPLSPILPLSPKTVYRYVNGRATFYGSEFRAAVSPVSAVTLRVSGSYLWGRDETLSEPAFGVKPPSADLGLRWTPSVRAEAVSDVYLDGTVHLTAEQDRVARTRGEQPTNGYTTVALRAGVRLLHRVEMTFGVQNLFDVTHANHLNAKNPFTGMQVPEPGRVFTTSLRVGF